MGLCYIITVIGAQVLREEREPAVGLRSRKKLRTTLAIESAALDLFDEQGYDATTVEQIADRAEVSTTTFFRYFGNKAEVVLNDHSRQLPALHQAIVDRPAAEDDLTAIEHALQTSWVGAIDPQLTARKWRIVGTSPLLRGLSFERGLRWLDTITEALAHRRELDVPDEHCSVAANAALGVLNAAVDSWMQAGCGDDLSDRIGRSFAVMAELCGSWLKP